MKFTKEGNHVIDDIINLSIKAGDAIMEIYDKDFAIEYKDDNSPLTDADKKANEIICTHLAEKYSDIPIISEENKKVDYEIRKNWNVAWIVDPIDGTKEFIKKNGEFTVNIALVENGVPILGVVYAPVLRKVYYGTLGDGSYVRNLDEDGPHKLPIPQIISNIVKPKIVASRSHMSDDTQRIIDEYTDWTGLEVELVQSGSSLKLCLVAEGTAKMYPRLAPTSEWDTAAAHAVCLYASKNVYKYTGHKVDDIENCEKPLQYNKEDLLNPHFIVI